MKITDLEEDLELLKWAIVLEAVTMILVFSDLFFRSEPTSSVQFVAAITALTAGVFHLIRHKKFESPKASFRSAVCFINGVFFLIVVIAVIVVKDP